MIGALLLFALLVAVGTPLARRLAPGALLSAQIGAGFLLGATTCALVLMLHSSAGIAWSRTSLFLTLVVVAVGIGFWARLDGAHLHRRPTEKRFPPTTLAKAIDAVTAITVLAHARYAVHAEVIEWDYVAMWGQKARVFFLARGIDLAFLSAPDRVIANADYPPLVPLLFDALAVARDTWDDRLVGLFSTAFGLALLLVARDTLRRAGLDATTLSLATLALSGAALSPWVGLAESAMLALLGAGWLAVREGVRSGSGQWLLLGGLLLGGATMAKNEGAAAVISALLAVSITLPWRRVPAAWARIGIPALLLALPWTLVRVGWHLQPLITQGQLLQRLAARLSDPLPWLAAMVRFPPDHLVYWLVAGAIVLFAVRRAWRTERFLLAALALQGSVYILQNAIVPADVRAHVMFSFHRLAAQVALPLGLLAILLLLHDTGLRTAVPVHSPELAGDRHPESTPERSVEVGFAS